MDPHVRLALALDALPGRFACLLGAGVSIAAGIPSAWQVQLELICRVAGAEGEPPPDDPEAWWYRRGGGTGYDDLLAALSPTQAGRAALLRPFFEPDEDERARGEKQPGAAHRAVARLVAAGHVPVVLTLNFDTLVETALRAEGIEPVVVASPDALAGVEPLNHQRALVVHLHGDYLSPSTLNTPQELAAYDPRLDAFLDEVFDRYGLLVAGWSAEWDIALRARLQQARSPRYGTWWIDVVPLRPAAQSLATARSADVIRDDAGAFLGRAVDAAAAVSARRFVDPVGASAAVGYAKRALAGQPVSIPLHDTLRREAGRVLDLEPVKTRSFDSGTVPGEYERRRDIVLAGTSTYLALAATACYWGDPETDRWWLPDVRRFVRRDLNGGLVSLLDLTRAPAALLTHAAGVAATAAERGPVVAGLLAGAEIGWPGQEPAPAAAGLGPHLVWQDSDPELRLYEHLSPLLADQLGLGGTLYEEAFERWTLLVHLVQDDLRRHRDKWYPGGPWRPRLTAEGWSHSYVASASSRLRASLDGDPLCLALLAAGAFGGDLDRLTQALVRFDTAYNDWANKAAWATLPPGGGMLPNGPFLPTRS